MGPIHRRKFIKESVYTAGAIIAAQAISISGTSAIGAASQVRNKLKMV